MIFSMKCKKVDHPPLYFNNIPATKITIQKHIGLYLDEKLNYSPHIKEKLSKVYNDIGFLRNLSNKLPRNADIYKVFIRPHFDYDSTV